MTVTTNLMMYCTLLILTCFPSQMRGCHYTMWSYLILLLTTEMKREVTVLCWPLKARNFAASKRFKRTGLTLEACKDQRIPQLHDPMGPNVPTIAKTAESNDLGHDPNDELLWIAMNFLFLFVLNKETRLQAGRNNPQLYCRYTSHILALDPKFWIWQVVILGATFAFRRSLVINLSPRWKQSQVKDGGHVLQPVSTQLSLSFWVNTCWVVLLENKIIRKW